VARPRRPQRIRGGLVPDGADHRPRGGAGGAVPRPRPRPVRDAVFSAGALSDGQVDLAFAAQVGRTIGRIHAATWNDAQIAEEFANDATFHAIRLEPYLEATAQRHPPLGNALLALSRSTLACHRALVHGDVSPKNVLAGPDGPVLLDAECACCGDPAFDLAFCLNHLLLKCLWNRAAARRLLQAFDALCAAYVEALPPAASDEVEGRAARLLPALLLARVDGKSPVEYITADADRDLVRAAAIPLIATPPSHLSAIRDAWAVALHLQDRSTE
jgi:Ser/Thr protein kinase RdoA (MazF antagonist)